MPTIIQVETDDQIMACFPAIKLLRPHLTEEGFVAQVRRQAAQGYRIIAIAEMDSVLAVAGWRLAEFLAWGYVLYIDDLITTPLARGQGYGGALLDWLIAYARAQGCAGVHLDTGYHRHDAHRLYLSKGFQLDCHHCHFPLRD